jgi:hypothetical protein
LPDSLPPELHEQLGVWTGFVLPPALRRERVAAACYAEMYVPQTAAWIFDLTSDDGSKLWIDRTLVIDHDGLHGATSKLGELALAQGWHEVRVEWFNKTGGAELRLSRAVAGSAQHPIPREHLRAAVPAEFMSRFGR